MTNINCSSDCKYQKDGKCALENVAKVPITPAKNCVYFKKVEP